MSRQLSLSVGLPVVLATLAALFPAPLPAGYHAFADHSIVCGLHPFGDTVSNLGFLVAGLYVWMVARTNLERFFALALALTCFGSWFYHLAPTDARLLVDRLPMAPAFAAMGALTLFAGNSREAGIFTALFSVLFAAAATVALWAGNQSYWVAAQIYVLLLVLAAVRTPALRRGAIAAFALYVGAKLCETYDHQILASLGFVSGHTLKHLFAALAPALWFALWRRQDDRAYGIHALSNLRQLS